MELSSAKLTFHIDGDAGNAAFIINGNPAGALYGSDFWRLILDDGMRTEIPVFSHAQQGVVREREGALEICYKTLRSDYGEEYPIELTVTVTRKDGLLCFTPALKNCTENVRVNECFCPLCDFSSLCGEKEQDALFLPHGLGRRIINPWKFLSDLTSSYYFHDEHEVFCHQHYPRGSMSWFGVQSGECFLYIARLDEKIRHHFQTVRQRIHGAPSNMMLGIDHFPFARPGESLTLAPTVVGLLDGDWRTAAQLYRAWAEKTFYRVPEKADWVRNLTGWQRIILRSQYGEDYYKAEDLPDIYREGAKHGIHTLFLFGWWKEGMDRSYPEYKEPYPGAFAVLRDNIRKVREMGGRVILECNCHFLDPSGDFYRLHGDEVKILDINGNEVRPAFVYPGAGEFRVTYGAVQFPLCCAGTERWRRQVMDQLRLMRELDPDCLFADCYGGTPYQPCFNDRHEHGSRVDEEWESHRKFFSEAQEYCKQEGKVLAAEIVTDIAASYTQFLHGLVNVDYRIKSDAFPQLFRYTFPEVITTERGIRDEEGDFDRRLKSALVMGMRYDCELYVCRADLGRAPKYASVIEFCAEKLNEYREFFFDGRFTVTDTAELPYQIKRGEYIDAGGERVLRVLYNASDKELDANGVCLKGNEMRFDIYDRAQYECAVAEGRRS